LRGGAGRRRRPHLRNHHRASPIGLPDRRHGCRAGLANDAARSFRTGRLIRNESEPQTLADGARTVSLGDRNWTILKDQLAGVVEVSEEQIVEAVRFLFTLANLKAEPTGALSVGALLAQPELFRGRAVCCVISGGNVDPAVYGKILEP
jgi:threonine dehydratase